jgi:hypothetical protein
MTNPLQSDDPLANLFLPAPQGPAVPLRYRSGLLTSYSVSTGENVVSIDGQIFTNLPVMPGSYLANLAENDIVSLMSTTDDRGITTYVIMGMSLTPPNNRLGRAAVGAAQVGQDGMQSEIQATSGNVTSTAYTDVLSAGFTPQVVFRSMTGKAIVHWGGYLVCGTSLGFAYMSFEIREGSAKGSGTQILLADDARAVINRDNSAGGGDSQSGWSYPVHNLVPGAFYNVQGMYRTSTGTSTFINRTLIVDPR